VREFGTLRQKTRNATVKWFTENWNSYTYI